MPLHHTMTGFAPSPASIHLFVMSHIQHAPYIESLPNNMLVKRHVLVMLFQLRCKYISFKRLLFEMEQTHNLRINELTLELGRWLVCQV